MLRHASSSFCFCTHLSSNLFEIFQYARRSFWRPYHLNVGRLALLLAFANIMIGLHLTSQGWGWYVGIALVWLAIWVIGGLGLALQRVRTSGRQPAGTSGPNGFRTAVPIDKHTW